MQEGRDAPAPALLTQCGSLGASTKSSARSFTSWLSSVSLYLHNFFFTPQQPEYYTWNFHPGASYVCQSLCTYWGNWVWAAPVTAENAGFWFVSHCQELELYFLRITHTQLWAFGSHLGMFLLGHVFFTIQDALVPAEKTGDGTWVPFQPEYIFVYCGQAYSSFTYPQNIKESLKNDRDVRNLPERTGFSSGW